MNNLSDYLKKTRKKKKKDQGKPKPSRRKDITKCRNKWNLKIGKQQRRSMKQKFFS